MRGEGSLIFSNCDWSDAQVQELAKVLGGADRVPTFFEGTAVHAVADEAGVFSWQLMDEAMHAVRPP